jgi:serine/threonine protein kinase
MLENPDTVLVLRIFQNAFSLPPEDRGAYLDQACEGSDELRREVQKLFDDMAQTKSTAFLETNVTEDYAQTSDGILLEGTEVGAYRLLRQIGKGGMGEVYLATRSSDYRAEVAVKVARRDSPHALARFRRERQILAFLNHPNVCRLLDGGSLPPDGRPYLVMEYVKGHLLHEHCDRKEYGFRERVDLLLQLCRAIAACHDRGIIHRDLSPNNVMATDDGAVKVMDYGLASFTQVHPEAALLREGLTSQLGVGVTLPYAPPEQIDFDGTQIPDERSDIYMLGSLMYRLLCGQPPFDGISRNDVVDAIRSRQPMRPRRIKPNLPIDLETVCLKCLEKNPESRYPTAKELAKDLERFLRNEPVKARRASLLERANRWRQRNRVLAALMAVLAVVTVIGIGSTLAAVYQALAFQATSQDVLGKLASALTESYFLNPSPYTFEQDFRDSLSGEIASYAERTLSSVREEPGKRPLLAAMHTQLAVRAFNQKRPAEGKNHYLESLRLWRLALHDDPTDKQVARSLAITLAFYANSQRQDPTLVSNFEENDLLPGFSYQHQVDRLAAASVATFWNQHGLAYKDTGSVAASVKAYEAAQLIWESLLNEEPSNTTYLRGLATAHFEQGVVHEDLEDNAKAADNEYLKAREVLIKSRTLSRLRLSDLKLLATATWRTANVNMRHHDWATGRLLFDEALSLGKECRELSSESLDSLGFLTDIQWHTIQWMRPSVPENERLEVVQECLLHLSELLKLEKLTYQDTGKLGACQFIVAKAGDRGRELDDILYFLKFALSNLTKACDNDKASRDTWLTWRSKVYLELGDLRLTSLPKTRKEYYQAALADAQLVYADVKEAVDLAYFANDRLKAIANEEAAAVPATTSN